MNCRPCHLYKVGISSTVFIEREMSFDLTATSESLVDLSTPGMCPLQVGSVGENRTLKHM